MLPETRYAYAVARVRVQELNMLDKGRIERMLGSDTFSGAARVLYEAGFPEKENYEDTLRLSTAEIYDYLREISPEPAVFDMFSYRYDSHNIKVLLKSEMSGRDTDGMLADNGVIEKNSLNVMLRERELKGLPEEFADAVEKSIDIYARTKNPQSIDILLDGAYYRLFNRLADESGSPFLKKLARMTIDISNINAFIRVKTGMEDLDLLSRVLVKGGSIPVETYTQAYGGELESFSEKLEDADYRKLFGYVSNGGGITEFEKACDDHMIKFVKKTRHNPFGIEPLVGYMLGRETDIKNARIILIGKINRIKTDIIRERLRESYV